MQLLTLQKVRAVPINSVCFSETKGSLDALAVLVGEQLYCEGVGRPSAPEPATDHEPAGAVWPHLVEAAAPPTPVCQLQQRAQLDAAAA